jgi:uncharacterized damage-inducible protein DinB
MPVHFLPTDLSDIFTRDLAAMAEEIRMTPEEQLWKPLPGITNSVGTLAYHLCGNLQHFIGNVLGNSGYVRNREAEFNRVNFSKEELVSELEKTSIVIQQTLITLSQEDLSLEMRDTPPHHKGRSVGYFLVQLVSHFARHRGQLDYLRRILQANH